MLYVSLEIFYKILLKQFPKKGVDIAIIYISWNVPGPSKALILWSALSPANCMNTFRYAFMTEFPIGWLATTDFYKHAHFRIWNEPFKSEYTRSHSIPRPNNSDGNAVRGRDALLIYWQIDDILTVSGTR